MFCMECGIKLPDGAKFCFQCGTPVGQVSAPAPIASAAPAVRGCTPGKKYKVFRIGEEDEISENNPSEREKTRLFYLYYTRLDDGTLVGWIYKHTKEYQDEKDYYYNLYRIEPDGTAVFLGTGSRSGIEDMFVLDGYAYWSGFGTDDKGPGAFRKSIYDDSPVERVEKLPD